MKGPSLLKKPLGHYKLEITGILLVKLLLIFVIKLVWFPDRPDVSDRVVADRLLSTQDSTVPQRKSHD